MKIQPRVGDIVRLTNDAYGRLVRTREAGKRADRLVITWVGENLTHPEPTWPIQVDCTDINHFLVSSDDVELVERPKNPVAPPPEHDMTPGWEIDLGDPASLQRAIDAGIVEVDETPRVGGFLRTITIR